MYSYKREAGGGWAPEAETVLTQLPAKECEQLPGTARDKYRALPSSRWRECGPADTLELAQGSWCRTSRLQSNERIHFCCLKPPSVWQFVPAAKGQGYRYIVGRHLSYQNLRAKSYTDELLTPANHLRTQHTGEQYNKFCPQHALEQRVAFLLEVPDEGVGLCLQAVFRGKYFSLNIRLLTKVPGNQDVRFVSPTSVSVKAL